MGLTEKSRSCELCREGATLYCEADLAFLCGDCDRKVHGANFLVARHARNVLCCRCNRRSEKRLWGGRPVLPAQSLCGLCDEQTSLCISTAESVIPGRPASGEAGSEAEADANPQFCCREAGAIDGPASEVSIDGWSYGEEGTSSSLPGQKISKNLQERPRRGAVQNAEMKAEAILTKWYRHLNLRNPSTVPLAVHLMEKSLCRVGGPAPVLDGQKVRISLAASLWLAATLCENAAQLPPVKKLQECTGIPSKLIAWSGSRLSKLLNWRRQQEEGWAECEN